MKTPNEKKTDRRKLEWVFLFLFALIMLGGVFVWKIPRTGATVAVILVEGKEVRRIPLTAAKEGTFSLFEDTGKYISYEILDENIRFINMECPDHICEKAGWCSTSGQRAVCMPNQAILVCYRADELK